MKNSIRYLLVICGVLLATVGCKHKRIPSLPPNVLFFRIEKDDHKLEDSVLMKIRLFYFDTHGNKVDAPPSNLDDKTFLFLASRHSTGMESTGVLSSGYVDQLVYSKGANTLFLSYPDGDIDTLYIEVKNIGHKDGAQDRCYCAFPFTIVKFNGKDAPEVTDLATDDGKPIYLFEKE